MNTQVSTARDTSHGQWPAAGSAAVPRPAVALQVGHRYDRYWIRAILGQGGMGMVYDAYDLQLQRRVALEVMLSTPREGQLQEPSVVAAQRSRLIREAQSLARLAHPNIVGVYEVGTLDDEVFVAMEFVQGLSNPTTWHFRGCMSIGRRACWRDLGRSPAEPCKSWKTALVCTNDSCGPSITIYSATLSCAPARKRCSKAPKLREPIVGLRAIFDDCTRPEFAATRQPSARNADFALQISIRHERFRTTSWRSY